tara:strand:+ start:434 stop:577 length:144 start_codon:yes stop_codon:yes gene_type:complete
MTDRGGNHSLLDIIETCVFILTIPVILMVVWVSDIFDNRKRRRRYNE